MTAPLRTGLAALVALSFATAPLAAQTSGESTYDAADPFIGTGGEGHTFPGAVAPFGMIQLSPDTDTTCVIRKCYGHAAGYRYEDPTIQGFSMTHFSGAGHSDLGDFLMMPMAGDAITPYPGMPSIPTWEAIAPASIMPRNGRLRAIMPSRSAIPAFAPR